MARRIAMNNTIFFMGLPPFGWSPNIYNADGGGLLHFSERLPFADASPCRARNSIIITLFEDEELFLEAAWSD